MGFMFCDLCFVIYMFFSNNPSSGDINLSNLPCSDGVLFLRDANEYI